jgi:hypothetical protein
MTYALYITFLTILNLIISQENNRTISIIIYCGIFFISYLPIHFIIVHLNDHN